MPNYSMDHDAEFWQAPDRFRVLFELAPKNGSPSSFFPMGDPDDDETPVAVVVNWEPGYVITRHAHTCERFEIVVRGRINDGTRDLVPGDVMTSHAYEFYGPKVAGPEGCTTVEIFSAATGVYQRVSEDENGVPRVHNLLTEFASVFSRGQD